MYSKVLVAALTAAIITVASAPAVKAGQPLSLAPPAIGAGAGYAVATGLRHGSTAGRAALVHMGGIGGATTLGFIAGVAALVGYEAIVCKTFGQDPLNLDCKYRSWRG